MNISNRQNKNKSLKIRNSKSNMVKESKNDNMRGP